MKTHISYFSFILFLQNLSVFVRTATTRKIHTTSHVSPILMSTSSTPKPYSSSTFKYHRSSTSTTCMVRPYVQSWTKESFPNPQTDITYDYCGRNCKKSWICNPGHMLKKFQADTLDKMIQDIKSSKKCGCPFSCRDGYSVSIGLVPEVKIEPWEPEDVVQKKVDDFSNYLRSTRWNFGACDNDVVIFISRNQRQFHISTGSVARKVLTNQCVSQIHSDATKYFKHERFYEGLVFMMNRFGEVFKYASCYPPNNEVGNPGSTVGIVSGGVVFLIIVIIVIVCAKKGKFKRRGSDYQPPTMHHRPRRNSNDSNEGFRETNTADGGGGGGGGF